MNTHFTLVRVLLTSILGMVLLLFLSSSIESEIGKTDLTKKTKDGSQGCFCHYQDEKLRVGILGPSTLQPGETAEYIVWVDKGDNVAAGFDVAAWAGELSTIDVDTREAFGELTHTKPKLAIPSTDTISWKFAYKAPSTLGTDTIYANGNNVNNQHDTDGDHWNFAPNFVVTIALPTGVEKYTHFLLKEPLLYPNPARQNAMLSFSVKDAGKYDIWIQSLDGKMVKQIVASHPLENGEHVFAMETTNITAGMYHVVIQSGLNKYVKLLQIQL